MIDVAYFPESIPRALELEPSTLKLLADAEAALGRLSGTGSLLPSPGLLIRPYLLREALSSTRIEGTQATMAEVLHAEAAGEPPNADVEEVVNYADAMEWGLAELDKLPLSTRLLRDMHRRLMAGVRGRELAPGELRVTQNWIAGRGSMIENALVVPPPPDQIQPLLNDWEMFAHEDAELPLLIQNALLHSQFETIHPFLDGNGRLGRLLLVFFLIVRGRLTTPLLYLSTYLERNRATYYAALQAIHETGDATPWFDLFLVAVRTQATDAVERAQSIIRLRDRYLGAAATISGANGIPLVELICENPVLTTRAIEDRLVVSRPTALRLLSRMEQRGVLTEIARGARRQRRYVAHEMMALVSEDA